MKEKAYPNASSEVRTLLRIRDVLYSDLALGFVRLILNTIQVCLLALILIVLTNG